MARRTWVLALLALGACGEDASPMDRDEIDVEAARMPNPALDGVNAANPPPSVVALGGEDPFFQGASFVAEIDTFQTTIPGEAVPDPPVLQLLDGTGQPLVGVELRFRAVGGGVVQPATALTDAQGRVAVEEWRVGKSVGTYGLDAAAGGGRLRFAAAATSSFSIQLEYRSTVSDAVRDAFDRAAARWSGVLQNDLPDRRFRLAELPRGCGFSSTDEREVRVDDLLISVRVINIDGEAGVLGQAGPCVLRGEGESPLVGAMEFDKADLEALQELERLEAVILHEMGHVLGFGTLWQGLVELPSIENGPGSNTRFTGDQAAAAYELIGGSDRGVPVENNGVPGSGDGHWRESTFRNELMSPRLGVGDESLPLSLVTASSFADLGYYGINPAATDSFELQSVFSLRIEPRFSPMVELRESLYFPTHVMDEDGTLRRR